MVIIDERDYRTLYWYRMIPVSVCESATCIGPAEVTDRAHVSVHNDPTDWIGDECLIDWQAGDLSDLRAGTVWGERHYERQQNP